MYCSPVVKEKVLFHKVVVISFWNACLLLKQGNAEAEKKLGHAPGPTTTL